MGAWIREKLTSPLAVAAYLGIPSALYGGALLRVADLSGWRYRGAETRPAVVDYCERTAHSVGGAPRRSGGGQGTPVFRHYFSFQEPTGARVSGFSYLTGDCLELGKTVTVEFPPGDPSRARIVGQRAKPYSGWLALLCVLPAAGLLVAGLIASNALFGWPDFDRRGSRRGGQAR